MKFKPTLKEKRLQQTTARDFTGGLNFVDSEYNLNSKFHVLGYNVVPDDSGGMQVRWGTRLFTNQASVATGYVVGMSYYFRFLIVVYSNGEIFAVDAGGTSVKVWSPAIAATLPNAPAGWSSSITRANFTQYLGDLIIVNGVDKPILLSNTLVVSYLQDLPTGSNIHVPVAKYVVAHNNYVVMAGDKDNPGRLFISATGTSGTWVGDAAPNDSITFDADKYSTDATGEITGLLSWRDRLVVFFSQNIITFKLGAFNTATPPVHTPTLDDKIESFGAVSQNSIIAIGDSIMFMDYAGVATIKSATFTNVLSPTRVSTLIDTFVQRSLRNKSTAFLQDRVYVVYDKRENRVMFHVPVTESTDPTSAWYTMVATLRGGTSQPAWAEFRGWRMFAACVSQEGRVFMVNDRQVYLYGSKVDPILSDFENFVAYNGVTADKAGIYVNGVACSPSLLGVGIPFYHELPHSPFGDRTVIKQLHYLSMDTQGASKFAVRISLDDTLKRSVSIGVAWSDATLFDDGTGWIEDSATPSNYYEMSFVGGDLGANGVTIPTQSTTGYRPTDDQRLYALYGRFKFLKMILYGTSWSHLRIAAISMYYTKGSIYQ